MPETVAGARPRQPVLGWLATHARVGDVGKPTDTIRAVFRWVLGPLADLLFPSRLIGLERLPADRPALLTANHSGGGVAEIVSLAWLLMQRTERTPITAMAHPLAFWVPGVAWFLRSLGVVPSTYEHAERALSRGISVLVFPGGAADAFHPITRARRVDFGGHRGFLRIARDMAVPVVPLGIRGSWWTLPVLWRSRLLPWLGVLPGVLGLTTLPVTPTWLAGLAAIALLAGPRAPWLAVLLAFVWTALPIWAFVPILPHTIRFELGEPILPEQLFEPSDETLDRAYGEVIERVQTLVDASKHPFS